jgi:hypothetical protein
VRDILAGQEAALRRHSGLARRLPRLSSRGVRRGVVAAWLSPDDAVFVAAVTALVPELSAPAFSGDRGDFVRAFMASDEVERVVIVDDLAWVDCLHTEPEIIAALCALAPGERLVRAAYALLLGREAEPGAIAHHSGRGRADVVGDIATSQEAVARGIPPEAGHRIAAAVAEAPIPILARVRRKVGLS